MNHVLKKAGADASASRGRQKLAVGALLMALLGAADVCTANTQLPCSPALLNKSELGKSPTVFCHFLDFHRHWHAKIGHPVQRRRTDPRFGLLLGQSACLHAVADDALVALDGQLNVAA